MSIIGAEDEDFENDLMNDVSVNQLIPCPPPPPTHPPLSVCCLAELFDIFLLLSAGGRPDPLQQYRTAEGQADPPACLPATCHPAV